MKRGLILLLMVICISLTACLNEPTTTTDYSTNPTNFPSTIPPTTITTTEPTTEEHVHSYGEWKVLSESTEETHGIREKECSECGDVVREELPLLEPHIKMYSYYKTTSIPRISINTEGGKAIDDRSLINPNEHKGQFNEIPVYDYINATISVSNCEGYELNNVEGKVKVRGNYTSTYPKRPIRIKFNKKQSMCGLNDGNKLKSWVLLAEYKDHSMLRNSVAAFLGNTLLSSNGIYCTDFRYVEVYINGVYNGLYVLAEQQETNKNRVNIPEALDPEDSDNEGLSEEELKNVKIGYFIEYDGYYNKEPEINQFTITYNEISRINGTRFTPSSPTSQGGFGFGWGGWGGSSRVVGFTIKSDVYYTEQNLFIKKCMQTIWNVLYDAMYRDHTNLESNPYHTMDCDGNYIVDRDITTVYEAVSKVINIESLVDMYIIQEILEDMDISWSSFFFELDMSDKGSKKLVYNAPWDFDSSLGNASGDTKRNDSFYVMNSDNPWLVIFSHQGWFFKLVNERFNEAYNKGVFLEVENMIDYYTSNFKEIYRANYQAYNTLGRKIEDRQVDDVRNFTSQEDASNYLKTWYTQRIINLKLLLQNESEKYD